MVFIKGLRLLGVDRFILGFFENFPLRIEALFKSQLMLLREFRELVFGLSGLLQGFGKRPLVVSDFLTNERFGDLGRLLTDAAGFGRCIFSNLRHFSFIGLMKLIQLKLERRALLLRRELCLFGLSNPCLQRGF